MAKNYASIYNSANDSIALDQKFYIKLESSRGTMVFPLGTDHFLTIPGGSIAFEQAYDINQQRSGRHNQSLLKKKKTTGWNFSTYFNIDTAEGAAIATEIDQAVRELWKSLLGREQNPGGLVYDSATTPDYSFTLMEIGDKWSRQSPGAFVQGGNIQLPGDGEATIEWSGNAKTAYFIGMGLSVTANAAKEITVAVGEGERFQVGGAVMGIKADGVTRSTDTPDGTPRTITAIVGDVITVDGAVLTDMDGTGGNIYLVYYEPENPVAIDDSITGLVGSISIVGLSSQCVRSLNVNIQNNHELRDNCYGSDALAGTLFVPGERLTIEPSISLNLNHAIVGFFNRKVNFDAEDVTAILGDAAGRHFKLEFPKVQFNVPAFSVPDTGSIPIEFAGTAFQTGLDAADEITASFL